MMPKKIIFILIAVLIVCLAAGYLAGNQIGYQAGYVKGDGDGYKRAETDIKKFEEEAAQKAVADATKAANPFQVTNPLEGVETDPFQKAKKVLNPF